MKVLKVTNSPQKPNGRCTEQKRTPTIPCLKGQCDVFGIPSKPSRSTNNKAICKPMSERPSSRNSQSIPLDKQSMQISNDYYKNSSSNQAVTDEVANTISL